MLCQSVSLRHWENSADAGGQVSVGTLVRAVQQMRIELAGLGRSPDEKGDERLYIEGLPKHSLRGSVVKHQRVKVCGVAYAGDTLHCTVWVSRVWKSSFAFGCVLRSAARQTPAHSHHSTPRSDGDYDESVVPAPDLPHESDCVSARGTLNVVALARVIMVLTRDGAAVELPANAAAALERTAKMPSVLEAEAHLIALLDPPQVSVEMLTKKPSAAAQYRLSGAQDPGSLDPSRFAYHTLVRHSDCDWNDHLTNSRYVDFAEDARISGFRRQGIAWLGGGGTESMGVEWYAFTYEKEVFEGDALQIVWEDHGAGDLRGAVLRTRSVRQEAIVFHHVPRVVARFQCRLRHAPAIPFLHAKM